MTCCNTMYLEILRRAESNITERYRNGDIKLRNAGNGLWLSILVPLALLSSIHHFSEWSELYRTVSFIGIGLFLSSCCNILHKDPFSPDSNNIPFIQIGYILSSTVVSLFLIFSSDRGVIYSLSIAVATSFAYHPVQESLLKYCPQSFTWGEASLISQSLILYLSSFAVNIILSFEKAPKSCGQIASVVLQTGYFAILTTVIIAYCFRSIMNDILVFLPILLMFGFIFIMVVPCFIFKFNSILWLWNLITDEISIKLIVLWAVCCLGAIFCLFLQTRKSKSATTVTRKSFHFIIFSVLLPGLIWKPCLIYVASGIGFALLIVIEMCRKLKISNFSETLQLCFDLFKDEKDEGEIALTPLYLMVGCSAPLWIYPFSYSTPLPLPVLGGIFPVAIGDAAASMGGMWLGKHKWKGSNKTVEGSIFCFISQLLLYILFVFLEIVEAKYWLWVSAVFVITSLIEAKTDQIDNLVLPFVTYVLFMFVT